MPINTHAAKRDRWRIHVSAWLVVLAFVVLASSPDGANGTSSSTVVSMDVPSAVSLTNNCQNPLGYQLGVVTPTLPAITATGAGICSMSWTSSNATAQLRIAQRDNTPTSMARLGGAATHSAYDNYTLNSVDTYDSTRTAAVGRGVFRWSTDGGSTWSETLGPAGSFCWCSDVEYVPGDPTRAFFVGNGAMIRVTGLPAPAYTNLFSTMTAGNPTNWPVAEDIWGVAVVSASTVVVVGQSGWVAKSTNANVATPAWTIFQLGVDNWEDVDALSASTMYMVGEAGGVGYTTLGGDTIGEWITGNVASTDTLIGIAIADATHLYAVGDSGRIFTCTANPCTTASWVDRTNAAVTEQILTDVGASGALPNTAYAIGHEGSIFKSTNGGVNWSAQNSPVNTSMVGIATSNGVHAVAVGGARQSISTVDGSAWTINDGTAGIHHLRDVDSASVDGRTLVGVGSAGSIRRSTDGGSVWSTIASGTSDSFFGVSFGSDTVGWAVGTNGRVMRTIDKGLTWSSQTSGTTVRLRSVHAIDEYAAWAVGDSGTVIRTINGGVSWSTIPISTTVHLRGVSAPTALNAWVVGDDSTIRITTNGGSSWTAPGAVPSPGYWLHGVTALDAQTAWVATNWIGIWKSTDGGVTWTSYNAGSQTWHSVEHASATVVYAGGNGGSWSVSTNGGVNWTSAANGNPAHFGVAAIDETRAVFAGESGRTSTVSPQLGATSQVVDYGAGPNNWTGGGTSSMFGVCLQDVSAATTVAAGWVKDTTGGPQCIANDSDPWRAIPAASTKIGSTLLGGVGRVDLVWGMRARSDQAVGSYSAGIAFEALAPDA